MRLSVKRVVSWAAIYAVALHAILLGVSPIAASALIAGDPFSIICHSNTQAVATDQSPSRPDLVPGNACEHCNLCSASAPPPAPDVAANGVILPLPVTHILRPASSAPRVGLTSDPKLARGPPQIV
jgi:hypothetical protein